MRTPRSARIRQAEGVPRPTYCSCQSGVFPRVGIDGVFGANHLTPRGLSSEVSPTRNAPAVESLSGYWGIGLC